MPVERCIVISGITLPETLVCLSTAFYRGIGGICLEWFTMSNQNERPVGVVNMTIFASAKGTVIMADGSEQTRHIEEQHSFTCPYYKDYYIPPNDNIPVPLKSTFLFVCCTFNREQEKEDEKLAEKYSLKINVSFGNGKGDMASTVFAIEPLPFCGKFLIDCTKLAGTSPIHYKGFNITRIDYDIHYFPIKSMIVRIMLLCRDFGFIFNELSTESIANYSKNDPHVSFYLPNGIGGKIEVAYGKKAK